MISLRKISLLFGFLFGFLSINAQNIDSIKQQRPTVALVLSGGGAKGFAEIGTLEALDELDIPVDYIVGTSMGSIMGGLYAIGYTGKQIADEVAQQKWSKVFTDAIVSRKTSVSIKDELSRYVFSFPMHGGIHLPKGIVRGQEVMNILSKYTINYHDKNDFLKFPIPYSAIATDLETGEAIVLDQGLLPQVMRASMSIPSAFTPTEIGDRVFIDGGTVNNFPTDVAKAKGIDYIIGVDVQSGLRSKKELNSALDITNQLVTMIGKSQNDANIKLADVYIHPNISKYSTSSFSEEEIDSLIAIGRRAAKKAYPQLLKIKKKLGKNSTKKELPDPNFDKVFHFNDITVKGLRETKKKIFYKNLKIKKKDSITTDELNAKIGDLSAILNLDLLNYTLRKDTLNFTAHERNIRRFNVGAHYDSDNNAGLLLNTTWDNLLLKNSRTSLDAILSENLQFTARYSIKLGNIPYINFKFDTKQYELSSYEENNKIAEADISYVKFDLNTQAILWNNYTAGIGVRQEYFDISNGLSLYAIDNKNNDWYTNLYGFIQMNTLDDSYYPTRGLRFNGEVKYVTDGDNKTGTIIYANYKRVFSFGRKFTTIANFYGRTILDNRLNAIYNNYWGGINPTTYFDNKIPFMGTNRVQNNENNNNAMAVLRLDLRYELFRNNYLTLMGNYGRYSNEVESFLHDETKNIWGTGLTYSYNSIIGPIAFTAMYSPEVRKPLLNISIGYNF